MKKVRKYCYKLNIYVYMYIYAIKEEKWKIETLEYSWSSVCNLLMTEEKKKQKD